MKKNQQDIDTPSPEEMKKPIAGLSASERIDWDWQFAEAQRGPIWTGRSLRNA